MGRPTKAQCTYVVAPCDLAQQRFDREIMRVDVIDGVAVLCHQIVAVV